MNILFVTYHTCARAAKEAKALERAGHQVIILQYVAASEEILYATELSSFYQNEDGLQSRIAYFSEWAEVIHVHNEPNWIVTAAAMQRDKSCDAVPVIFDVHDLESMRESTEVDRYETAAIASADGFIFPSIPYERGVRNQRNIAPVPSRVIYSMCLEEDIVPHALPRVNGLVYEGAILAPGITPKMQHFNRSMPGYKLYREYTGLCAELTKRSVPVHLYGVRKDFQAQYLQAGAIAHDMIPFTDMLRQLSRYDWGLCGNLDQHPQWDKAMPNKLFEYMAAGIPTVAINAREVANFIRRHEVGFIVNTVEELCNLVQNRPLREEVAANVLAKRKSFTMESQVKEIEGLYAEAAAYRKSRLDGGLRMRTVGAGAVSSGSWVCRFRPEDATKDYLRGDQLRSNLSGPNYVDPQEVQGEPYP